MKKSYVKVKILNIWKNSEIFDIVRIWRQINGMANNGAKIPEGLYFPQNELHQYSDQDS